MHRNWRRRTRRRRAASTESGRGDLLRRFPLVLARFFLDLLPVLAFAIGGHIFAATPLAGTEQTRLIVLAMIDAYAVCGAVFCFVRMLVSPEAGRLRLLQVSDATAAWVMRWTRRIVLVFVFGYTIAEVGAVLGMSMPAHDGLLKMAGLVNHIFLAIMVLQKRRAVKQRLRAPAGATGHGPARNAVAPIWHWIALFFLAALWFVWAVEIRNGFAKVLHFFIVFVVVAIVSRLVLIVLLGSAERLMRPSPDMAERYPGLPARLRIYHPILSGVIRGIVYVVAGIFLLQFWGVDIITGFRRVSSESGSPRDCAQ